MNAIRHQAAGRSLGNPVPVVTAGAQAEVRNLHPAEPRALALVREEFGALAERHGATGEQVDAIRLLVSEAVTNAVRHAYPDGPGTVDTVATVGGGWITIVVSDDGVGLRTACRDPGAGWGWPLIAALTERFTIRHRSNGGTEVEMRVPLSREREVD
jgi:anti-sigma regulatory factor (Ser/Thr protein kinase)